jgi:hypothetical protein
MAISVKVESGIWKKRNIEFQWAGGVGIDSWFNMVLYSFFLV